MSETQNIPQLSLAALGHWIRADEDLPDNLEDGDQFLVAVPVRWNSGFKRSTTLEAEYYEYSVITFDCDEDGYLIQCNGESWGWEWSCVDFYIPLNGERK